MISLEGLDNTGSYDSNRKIAKASAELAFDVPTASSLVVMLNHRSSFPVGANLLLPVVNVSS